MKTEIKFFTQSQDGRKLIANLCYGFEKSTGINKLENNWISQSLTEKQKDLFDSVWHLFAKTRVDFAFMLIGKK